MQNEEAKAKDKDLAETYGDAYRAARGVVSDDVWARFSALRTGENLPTAALRLLDLGGVNEEMVRHLVAVRHEQFMSPKMEAATLLAADKGAIVDKSQPMLQRILMAAGRKATVGAGAAIEAATQHDMLLGEMLKNKEYDERIGKKATEESVEDTLVLLDLVTTITEVLEREAIFHQLNHGKVGIREALSRSVSIATPVTEAQQRGEALAPVVEQILKSGICGPRPVGAKVAKPVARPGLSQ